MVQYYAGSRGNCGVACEILSHAHAMTSAGVREGQSMSVNTMAPQPSHSAGPNRAMEEQTR